MNSKKQIIISDRYGYGDSFEQPKVKATRDSQLSTTLYSGFDGRILCITYVRKLDGDKENNGRDISNMTLDYIWAWSNTPPNEIDDPSSDLPSHGNNHGTLKVNLLLTNATAQVAAKGYSSSPIYLIHGILMVLAWFVMALFGSLVARFGRTMYGTKWFPIHVTLMILVILITIISAVLVIWKTKPNFKTPHNLLGLIITITAFFQGILGYVIHILYDPDRDGVPWYDWIHRIVGYVLVPLGMLNCILGIIKFNNNIIVWLSISSVLAVLIILYFFVSYRRSANESESDSYGGSTRSALGYDNRRADYNTDSRFDNYKYGEQTKLQQAAPVDGGNYSFFDKFKGWFGMGGSTNAGVGGGAAARGYTAGNDNNPQIYDDNTQTDWTYGSRRGTAYQYYDDSYNSNDSRDGRYRPHTKSRITRNGGRTSYYRSQGRDFLDDRY